MDTEHATPAEAVATGEPAAQSPRTRRDLIRGSLAGAAGLVLGSLGRPRQADAAAGGNMLLGRANSAGTAATSLATKATGTALTVTQTGTGGGLKASATSGAGATIASTANNGLSATTAGAGKAGLAAANNAATTGVGAAVRADGKQNSALIATNATTAAQTVRVANTAAGTGAAAGVGIRVLAGESTDATIAAAAVLPAAGEFASSGIGVTAVGAVGVDGYGQPGVRGTSPSGVGVYGKTNTSAGVQGVAASGFGVYGASDTGYGVYGYSDTGVAVSAVSNSGAAITADSSYSIGAYSYSWASHAIKGVSDHQNGVWGITNATNATGVYGEATDSGSYALYSKGKFGVLGNSLLTGNLQVTGNITKGSGTFRIDHPLDPANKFLSHSFVESPEMKNVYDGVVTLDALGGATVAMPAWFEALNRDTRFQLTPMGASMPDLHVAHGIKDGTFAIAGGRPGKDVCWQVTGIRKDAYALAHPTPVEEDKTGEERGRYLHPAEHGQPDAKGLHHLHAPLHGDALPKDALPPRPKDAVSPRP